MQHRGGALQRVAHQRRGREPLAAGAQHIGGADIARTDLADIAEPGEARENQAEGDRAEQIADTRAARSESRSDRRQDIRFPLQTERRSNTIRACNQRQRHLPCSRASSNGVFFERERSCRLSST